MSDKERWRDMMRGLAVQDQEIAKGAAWLAASDPEDVKRLWELCNDANVNGILKADPNEIKVICALACIGMFEVLKASDQK